MGTTAADDVYGGLWDDIRSGSVQPGTAIREEAIAERFGVSRTPVREALRRLTQEGLLERSSRGLVVPHVSPQKMYEVYPITAALEGLAAREMASHDDKVAIARLDDLNTRMREAAKANDVAHYVDLNSQFHNFILESSGNPTLVQTAQRFRAMVRHYRHVAFRMPGRMETSCTEHDRVIGAIRIGDSAGADHAMREHISQTPSILDVAFTLLDTGGGA